MKKRNKKYVPVQVPKAQPAVRLREFLNTERMTVVPMVHFPNREKPPKLAVFLLEKVLGKIWGMQLLVVAQDLPEVPQS